MKKLAVAAATVLAAGGLTLGLTQSVGTGCAAGFGTSAAQACATPTFSTAAAGTSCTKADASGCLNATPGTTITFTNSSSPDDSFFMDCTGNLDAYRPNDTTNTTVTGSGYPVRVNFNFSGTFNPNVTAVLNLANGCTAANDANHSTGIDLIVNMQGDGQNYGGAQDGMKVQKGAHDINMSGNINCGPAAAGAHQDGIQTQGGDSIGLYWVTIGNWSGHRSTCRGDGGGLFYSKSTINQVDYFTTNLVATHLKVIACNKGSNGWGQWTDGSLTNSEFRTGNPADYSNQQNPPQCATNVDPGNPCVNSTPNTNCNNGGAGVTLSGNLGEKWCQTGCAWSPGFNPAND